MGTYRKLPVEIQAIQFTGDNIEAIWDAFGTDGIYGPTENNPDHLILTTVHGDPAPARVGDWVIPDGRPGAFYPCKPEIFAKTYEAVPGRGEEAADPEPFFEPGKTYLTANKAFEFTCERVVDGVAIGREREFDLRWNPANRRVWHSVMPEGCWTEVAPQEESDD